MLRQNPGLVQANPGCGLHCVVAGPSWFAPLPRLLGSAVERCGGRSLGDTTKRLTYEEQRDINFVIVGSPETVTRKLTDAISQLNPGYLHIYGNEGAMPHADVMHPIELIGKEVVPALHKIKLQPYD